jgi:hypothetical protein
MLNKKAKQEETNGEKRSTWLSMIFFKSFSSPPPPPPSFATPQRGRSENKKLVYILSQTLNF